MHTRSLFKTLGFQEDWNAIADELPAYSYDFGNLVLTAAQVISRNFVPVFLFLGVIRDDRSVGMVQFEMPLQVESLEQGVAWISSGLGTRFQPHIPTPWLADGREWKDHLPWMRERKAYELRPQCTIKKDWFRVAAKELRAVATTASESDLGWLIFDGEALRVSVRGTTVIVPATGTAWDSRYSIRAKHLDHLPKRLTDPVVVSVWDAKLKIGNRVWTLTPPDHVTNGSA